MTETDPYLEIALAELAHIVVRSGGDPAILNAAAGFESYFERDPVLELGRAIQEARQESDPNVDPAVQQQLARYFDSAGAVIANCASALVVHRPGEPSVTRMYFPVSDGAAEIVLSNGRSSLALRGGPLTVGDLLRSLPGDNAETLVVARVTPGRHRRYLAICEGIAAYSNDGDTWTAPDTDERRETAGILREFVADVSP